VFTRVRAAYALARIEPERGSALLDRLAKHPRPAVREAVAEARVNLAKLAARSEPTDGDAYRRE
jgi:HEAT repeat protein